MEKKLPLLDIITISMRWGDMDAVGHLNNTYYFRYMEQIRVEWLDAAGFPIDPSGIGPVLGATSCTYKRELTYPATVAITIEVEKVGRSSLKLRHHFYKQGDPDTIYAVGEATLVWVDYQAGKSVSIPEPLRERLRAAGAEA
ncbi:acyl-CoA thioesterase [Vogesella oryzae]|uniref:acyl-CoA thioesterase n=1 Tax=Vogesella oryzae TaxID=1735285 RepID=UPI0015836F8D|nr:thioesterase family protein [Vogesella oryzae]